MVGGALIVGYFLLTNPDLLSGIFPNAVNTNADTGTAAPVDSSGEFTDTSGQSNPNDSSNCSSLCKAGDCDGYDSEGCSKGCSKCKGSSGSSSSSSSSSSGGSNCNDGNSCQTRCTNGWCNSLRDCCKSFNCDKCSGGGGSSSSGGGGTGSCASKCKSGLKVARESPCTCTKCGKINCSSSSSGGSSSGSSSSGGSGCKSCCSCRGGACKGLSGGTCSSCCSPPKPKAAPKPAPKPTPAKTSQCSGFTGATKTACLNSHVAMIKETAFRISLS